MKEMEDELQDIINELERLYQHKWDPDLGIQIIRLKLLLLNKNISMKDKLKFLFQDKTVYPVFAMCGLFHLFIAFYNKDLFSAGWLLPTFVITMSNIGVMFCILYAIKKWKGGKK